MKEKENARACVGSYDEKCNRNYDDVKTDAAKKHAERLRFGRNSRLRWSILRGRAGSFRYHQEA